ncbi:MAG: hypothetical protein PHE83_09460 [Opitutaceae bacterium]|nr:hypothetical protein [Opitutaceae bacterium]
MKNSLRALPLAQIQTCEAPARPLFPHFFCAILGHRDVTTATHLITGEPIYRVRVCTRCHRRTVEILRD